MRTTIKIHPIIARVGPVSDVESKGIPTNIPTNAGPNHMFATTVCVAPVIPYLGIIRISRVPGRSTFLRIDHPQTHRSKAETLERACANSGSFVLLLGTVVLLLTKRSQRGVDCQCTQAEIES